MGQTEIKGVTVDHDYDYIDHATGERKLASLDPSALHAMDVQALQKHTIKSWNIMRNQLNGCSLPSMTSPSNHFALAVIEQARHMALDVCREPQDVSDRHWQGPQQHDPLSALLDETQIEHLFSRISSLAEGCRRALSTEPSLVKADVPAKVFGDIHGQFRDMLLLLSDFGFPDSGGPTYIFNGDWVDRGAHQLEVVVLVFAFKVAFPDRVKLLRGNHEDATQNRHMGVHGFDQACIRRLGPHFGPMCFDVIGKVFDWLPFGCLVGNKILVVHGGIGDGNWRLEQLARTQRPMNHDQLASNHMVYNILWSDPIPEDVEESFGVHDSPRDNHAHLIRCFGKDVTDGFCEVNGVHMLIRSHQAKREGCGYEVMHGGRCVRVFSARDYEESGNDGCVLSITTDGDTYVVRPQVLRSLFKCQRPQRGSMQVQLPPAALQPAPGFQQQQFQSEPQAIPPNQRGNAFFEHPVAPAAVSQQRDPMSSQMSQGGNSRAPPPPPPKCHDNPFQAIYEGQDSPAGNARQPYYNSGRDVGNGTATPSAYSAPPGSRAPQQQQQPSQMQSQGLQQDQQEIEALLARSRVLPFGVLGTQYLIDQRVAQTGPPPDANMVIVDLTSMTQVQPPGGPSHAGGMNRYTGQIYTWLGIASDFHFPPDVVQHVTQPGEAKYHAYDEERHVIHVAEPDLRSAQTPDQAVKELSDSYCGVLREFAFSGRAVLRLAPLCTGKPATAGPFAQNLPGMTAVALRRGFMDLQPQEQRVVLERELQICVYAESDLPYYESAIHYSGELG